MKKVKEYKLHVAFDGGGYFTSFTKNISAHKKQVDDIRKAIKDNSVLILNNEDGTYEIPFPRKITNFVMYEREIEEAE